MNRSADWTSSPAASMSTATGRTAGIADTTISGIVLDNSNLPVPGTTLRILGRPLTTTANSQGVFKLTGVPVGLVKLIVDGSTTSRPGAWPDLEFVMATIPGRDNTLGMPSFLLPIDLAQGVLIDETHGGRITLANVPGFALDVLPGSVTFPGGSRSGVVSVTAVHSDKVPMVPNFGQQPRLIVTIQPAGARFDPPARLTLPNLEGYAPGRVTEIYSFDHDLGHFVSIGPATVSDDGASIVSNPGVGIVKAGWHCSGYPSSSGTSHNCPECWKCVNDYCAADNLRPCDDHDECTTGDICREGVCKGDPVTVTEIKGNCVGAVDQAISLTAVSNRADKIEWLAPSGTPARGKGATFAVTYSNEGDFLVNAMCKSSLKAKRVSTGPDCGSIVAVLNEPEVAGGTRGNWGLVQPGSQKVGKYKGCATGGKWCFRLEEYLEEHTFGIDGGAAIDISGPADSDVTPATCAAIIADLTPPAVGTPLGPPRSRYWSQVITISHERFHVMDLHNRITSKVFADLETFVKQSSPCTDCKSAVSQATLDAKMDSLFSIYFTDVIRNAEKLAHNYSNPLYGTLISGIKVRARSSPASEAWPAACK
ncbi:MAG: hypothetical protein ABJC13_22920 [Acidobacteriota bacterium]